MILISFQMNASASVLRGNCVVILWSIKVALRLNAPYWVPWRVWGQRLRRRLYPRPEWRSPWSQYLPRSAAADWRLRPPWVRWGSHSLVVWAGGSAVGGLWASWGYDTNWQDDRSMPSSVKPCELWSFFNFSFAWQLNIRRMAKVSDISFGR